MVVGVSLAAAGSVGMLAATAPPANARIPTPVEASYQVMLAQCTLTNSGQFIAQGKIRSTVKQVPDASKKYYQKVTIRIDHGETTLWRSLEKRSYSTLTFSKSSYTTPGVKSPVGPTMANGENLRVRLDAKLKQVRTGPDKTVWKYTAYSSTFSCEIGTPKV